MEHIVQFAIGVDDEAIRKRIEETAEDKIIGEIKDEVKQKLFHKNLYGSTYELDSWMTDLVVRTIMEHKEDIIRSASMELASRLSRTKAVKQAVGEVLEGMKNE